MNLKTMHFENDPFSVCTPKTETFEKVVHSFGNRLLITMAFNVAIGTVLTVINKGFVLKRGLNSIVLLEQCERLSFS